MKREIKFKFVYKNDSGDINISRPFDLIKILDFSEDDIYCSLLSCNCQPVGETNVVECNCEEELDGYILFSKIQYTGLKDKNGTEIYEGDICTKMISTDENNLAPKELHRGEIVYHYGGFCYKSDGHYFPMSRTHGVVNIIGNIYQNPELLTDKQTLTE